MKLHGIVHIDALVKLVDLNFGGILALILADSTRVLFSKKRSTTCLLHLLPARGNFNQLPKQFFGLYCVLFLPLSVVIATLYLPFLDRFQK